MSRRLIEHDAFTGVTQYFHYDATNDTFFIESVQDTTAQLEANRAEYNTYNSGKDRWGDFAKVGHVPFVVVNDLMASGKWWDKAAMRKWWNDENQRPFRTRPGNI